MRQPQQPQYVSVHGGHSGQFCDHAKDSLEEIINAYIDKGFTWVGITEHTPAISEAVLDPWQKKSGVTPESLYMTFTDYFSTCRQLQKKYRDKIEILAAMEIETYQGYEKFVPELVSEFSPDYFVGSVHFLNNICFDYSQTEYAKAAESTGGINHLYLHYFDRQLEMIELLKPAVVGHFDLIRIFDPHYKKRLLQPEIMARITRNLEVIQKHDLILDFNLRALLKGADEPYISKPILELAKEMEIAIVPGDDAHAVNDVGANMDKGIVILQNSGISTDWKKPAAISSPKKRATSSSCGL